MNTVSRRHVYTEVRWPRPGGPLSRRGGCPIKTFKRFLACAAWLAVAVAPPVVLAVLFARDGDHTDPRSGYPRRDASERHEALGPVWVVRDGGGVARAVIYQNGARLRADSQAPALVSDPAEAPGIDPDDFPLVLFRSYLDSPGVLRRCRDGVLCLANHRPGFPPAGDVSGHPISGA